MTTNVPSIQFTPTGIILPTDAAILQGRIQDIDAAFGGGTNPALNTPQGQIASSDSAIISDKNAQIATIVAQVDPAVAAGRMQDAIGRIYFIDRKPAVPTSVIATCFGGTGTVIPVGALARALDGTVYQCVQAGTIPATGSIDLAFEAVQAGPIALAANQLTQIYTAIPGWDSITNSAPGATGADVESRADFEFRRRQSVAINGLNTVQAVYANVFAVDDVLDVYAVDNPLGTSAVVGGVTLAAHSLYVAVVGGAIADVANAIWKHKPPGCDYNGSTTYTVEDMNYDQPRPQYPVKWTTPTAVPIKYAVQIASNPSLPSDIVAQTKAAIINAFNGADGGSRARVGATIFASRYYAPISNISPYVNILSLLLGKNVTPASASVTMNIDERPTLVDTDISVTIV